MMEETDLFDPSEAPADEIAFPPSVPLQNSVLSLQYAYRPGKEDDGRHVGREPSRGAKIVAGGTRLGDPGPPGGKGGILSSGATQGAEADICSPRGECGEDGRCRGLPSGRATGGRETVAEALAAEIRERHRVGVAASIWAGKTPPDHLQVRVRVKNEAGAELIASRDWAEIAAVVEASAGIDRQ